jgi:thiamine biosynthesis lipoprotein
MKGCCDVKRIGIALAACIVVLYMLSGCMGKKAVSQSGFYFDTFISVSIEDRKYQEGMESEELLEGCFSICGELEDTFSRTDEKSELYQINHRGEDTVTVSDEMAYVVGEGLKYYELSGGVFDITVAPVLELWDFKDKEGVIPEEGDIQRAVSKVDASGIHLEGNQLTFDRKDTQIDLGALVKGYGADRLKEYLMEQGVESGIINLGGNVLTIGNNLEGKPWKVGIQKPFYQRETTIATISVDGKSVVSSGIYERYFEKDGVKYHHILDPRTGYPVQNGLWQVTIISENSLEGDALSTICMLLGEARARKLLAGLDGVEGKFVLDGGKLVE